MREGIKRERSAGGKPHAAPELPAQRLAPLVRLTLTGALVIAGLCTAQEPTNGSSAGSSGAGQGLSEKGALERLACVRRAARAAG